LAYAMIVYMTSRHYIGIAAFILCLGGIANLSSWYFYLPVLQGLFHIALGLFGFYSIYTGEEYRYLASSVVIMIVLAAFGFAGFSTMFGIIDFGRFVEWGYLALGLSGVWFYLSERTRRLA
jgi:hypothetical protein